MKLRFRWTERDETYGNSGWLPLHIKQGDAAMDGRALAHDALEHGLADTEGGFEGECQAFGAMIATRVECGDLGTPYIPDWRVHIAADLAEFVMQRFVYGNDSIKPCPHRVRIDPEVSLSMQQCLRRAYERQRREADDAERAGEIYRAFEYVKPHALAWMRHGYRVTKTKLRRARIDAWTVSTMFKAMDRMPHGEFEGQQMTVRVNLKHADVKFELHDLNEYGY